MIKLNPFAISGLLITIAYLPLFLLIFIKGKTKLSKIFSMHILSIFIWGISCFVSTSTSNVKVIILWQKFAYSAGLFIPVFFYHSVSLILKNKSKLLLRLVYLQALFFLFHVFSNNMFLPPKLIFNSFYWLQATKLYLSSFLIWITIVGLTHCQLILFYKNSFPMQKKQISLLIFAIVGFIGGISNFLISFNIKIYPYGNFLIPIHSIIITYAILKHHLLNLDIVIKKSIVYSILIALISTIYLLIVVLFEKILQGFFGYKSILVSIVTAFTLGVIFVPLRNKIQIIIDNIFFQKTPMEMEKENLLLRQEVAQTEKLKATATLASGMAHEIKNPLTAIQTFCEKLPQKLNDKNFLMKFSRIVGNESRRINELVHQLTDFAKPTPPLFELSDLNAIIQDTLHLLDSNLIKHKIKTTLNLDKKTDLILNVDPKQIKQALLNIFLNAIDAMPKGGDLTISANLQQKRIKSVIICVQDTGDGITSKDLPHIFDPFFTKKDHGTGLGLSITHQIINEHGGSIKVESANGKGTKIVIELPKS